MIHICVHSEPIRTVPIMDKCLFSANEPFEQMRTMDNGGYPFHVTHDAERKLLTIRVIDTKASKKAWESCEAPKYIRESDMIESTDGAKVFVEGTDVYVPCMAVHYESYWMGRTQHKSRLPSCLLIHVKDDEYIYLSMDMIQFKSKGPVVDFFSEVNGSSCVYSWVQIGPRVLYLDRHLEMPVSMRPEALDCVFDVMEEHRVKFPFEYLKKRPCDDK